MQSNFYDALTKAVDCHFGRRPILVIGDLILDGYYWGEVSRISPEAPVPVVHVQSTSWTAGGAANVAMNLAGLGLQVSLAGMVGNDHDGERLIGLLNDRKVDTSRVLAAGQWQTIVKTRIIARNQQLLRLDQEGPLQIDPAEFEGWWINLQTALSARPSAIVLSDYGKGLLSAERCQQIISEAQRMAIPVLVDPKGKDFSKYAGATLISPNRAEMAAAANVSAGDFAELLGAAGQMSAALAIPHFLVTLSEQGIAHIHQGKHQQYPALAQEICDVAGAGDTVIALIAAGMVGGLDWPLSIYLANVAAGLAVSRVGVHPVCRQELLAALSREHSLGQADKVCTSQQLMARIAVWRNGGERIVFTNGCFDLLHAGHVSYLEQARALGDRLIVGLNTDRSVRAIKGPARPVIGQEDRARVLAALATVDGVILFDEPTPIDLIHLISPDTLVKGADYTEEQVVGADFVKAAGGQVALIPLLAGRSSSGIIHNLIDRNATNPADQEGTACTS